ncbi:MAG: TAXI family TRAP transporter solute-binding subunit [Pseudomonadota bacterium]
MTVRRGVALVTVLFLIAGLGTVSARAGDKKLIIATATPGGTYHPVGAALASLIGAKLSQARGITAAAVNSAGSGENLRLLANKTADLAILQALFGLEAYHGRGAYEGRAVKDFAAVTMLWENVEHFVVLGDQAKTGTMADLQGFGKKFSIGSKGSGTEGSGRAILSALGLDPDRDLALEFLGYDDSAQAMLDGRIFGANIPAGPPAPAVARLHAEPGPGKVKVLDFTDEQLAAIRRSHPIWTRYVIAAGTYPGQDRPINTIAQPNFLACRSDLPEETVYLITKTIYENLPLLEKAHPATAAMSLERAVLGLPAPLHPGALKYYREVGAIK